MHFPPNPMIPKRLTRSDAMVTCESVVEIPLQGASSAGVKGIPSASLRVGSSTAWKVRFANSHFAQDDKAIEAG
jgi:hypothetical protein